MVSKVLTLILTIVVTISIQSTSARADFKAQYILNKLCQTANIRECPNVIELDLARPNAYAVAPSQIIISTGLLALLENSAELAFVLAHELGHLALKHGGAVQALTAEGRAKFEFEADEFARILLAKTKYSSKAGGALLTRLSKANSLTHGNLAQGYPTLKLRASTLSLDK